MFDLSAYTFLVIDDEDDNLTVLESTLTMLHGASVRVARSAEEALAILDEFHPTAIITDLSMPKIDGFELLEILRRKTNTSGLPVIAVTAHAMIGDKERVLSAGFDGYISKPFDVTKVGEQIGSLIEAHRVRQAGTRAENHLIALPEILAESAQWSKFPGEIP